MWNQGPEPTRLVARDSQGTTPSRVTTPTPSGVRICTSRVRIWTKCVRICTSRVDTTPSRVRIGAYMSPKVPSFEPPAHNLESRARNLIAVSIHD